jgi:hypothetical protein
MDDLDKLTLTLGSIAVSMIISGYVWAATLHLVSTVLTW